MVIFIAFRLSQETQKHLFNVVFSNCAKRLRGGPTLFRALYKCSVGFYVLFFCFCKVYSTAAAICAAGHRPYEVGISVNSGVARNFEWGFENVQGVYLLSFSPSVRSLFPRGEGGRLERDERYFFSRPFWCRHSRIPTFHQHPKFKTIFLQNIFAKGVHLSN